MATVVFHVVFVCETSLGFTNLRHHVSDGPTRIRFRATALGPGAALSSASSEFLQSRLEVSRDPAEASLSFDLQAALLPVSPARVVGAAIVRPWAPRRACALDEFDPECIMWRQLEGPSWQCVSFEIVDACGFADEVHVVPANDVSESGRPIFNVSAETVYACRNSLQPIIIKARQRGLTADEAAPVAAIALPRAHVVLAARPGSLRRIDVSIHRRIGRGTPLSYHFAQLRESAHPPEDDDNRPSESDSFNFSMFLAIAQIRSHGIQACKAKQQKQI